MANRCFFYFKNFVNIVYVKHLLFQSKAEYHAGNQAQTDRKYGLKVVRYEVSKQHNEINNEIYFI